MRGVQAGGPGTGKTTLCHNLARLLASVDPSWSARILEESCGLDNVATAGGDATAIGREGSLEGLAPPGMRQTSVSFFMEGDTRLPFQYRLLVRPDPFLHALEGSTLNPAFERIRTT